MGEIIFIIEDDEELRLIYRQTLARLDYEIHESPDGADALITIRNTST